MWLPSQTLGGCSTHTSSLPAKLKNYSEPTPERLMCLEKQKKTATEILWKADTGRSMTSIMNVLTSLVEQFYTCHNIPIFCYPQISLIKLKNPFWCLLLPGAQLAGLRKCQISASLDCHYRPTICTLAGKFLSFMERSLTLLHDT